MKRLVCPTWRKEQNLISWAREKRDRSSIIGALELQDASKATELDAVKGELTRVRSSQGPAPESPAQVNPVGCKYSQHRGTRHYSWAWTHHTWVAHQQSRAERER